MNSKTSGKPDLLEFEELFHRNHKFLCMIALNQVKDPQVAEDLVQEFFINFWERKDAITLQTSFEAYACRAVKNKCISWIRAQETQGRKISTLDYPVLEDPMFEALAAEDKNALELKVLKMVDELPPERKKIFLLSTVEGLTYAQIAEKLGISINTVKSQIVKAYATLREKAGPIFYTIILYILFSGT